jgi:hypothetical protein
MGYYKTKLVGLVVDCGGEADENFIFMLFSA